MHLGEPLPEDKLQKVQFNYGTLLLYFCVPYAFMMWTNGVGASTGMFVPALAIGAVGNPHSLSFALLLCFTFFISAENSLVCFPQSNLKRALHQAIFGFLLCNS